MIRDTVAPTFTVTAPGSSAPLAASIPHVPEIVVVDDDPLSLELMQMVLERVAHCDLRPFSDPFEAIEYASKTAPDLVITDYEMKGMNGTDVIRTLRRTPATSRIPIVMVTASHDRATRNAALAAGASDFLTKPLDADEIILRVRNMLVVRESQRMIEQRADWLATEVKRAMMQLAEREREIIMRLSRAAEFRDEDTGAHVQRIAEYARIIANRLGLDAHAIEQIYLASPMHDVGKIGISDLILHKPGALDTEEHRAMRCHTIIGHEILSGSSVDLLQLAAEIALRHHERWDGSGYPDGLAGDAIPLSARIVAVADVFDALTSARPYKMPWPLTDAMAEIARHAGTHFDPACVVAFMESTAEIHAAYHRLQD